MQLPFFLSRLQFFANCNKQTANLMMNAILMADGFHPISIKGDDFNEKVAKFYETAKEDEILLFSNDIAYT